MSSFTPLPRPGAYLNFQCLQGWTVEGLEQYHELTKPSAQKPGFHSFLLPGIGTWVPLTHKLMPVSYSFVFKIDASCLLTCST